MSWQKDIGTRFEIQVRDRFNEAAAGTALSAVRIWYSGAGEREPFDVGIYSGEVRRENLVMQIEAKRTQGRSLGLLRKWLEKISLGPVRHVIMFSVGLHNPIPIYVAQLEPASLSADAKVILIKDGAKSVSVHERYVLKAGLPSFLIAGSVGFKSVVVEPFESYIKREFDLPREAKP